MPRAPYRTDLGIGWVDYEDAAVTGIRLPGPGPGPETPAHAPGAVADLVADLEAYFAGTAHFLPSGPLVAAAGTTAFTRAVYRVVAAIPPGRTMTYGEVAAAAGRPGAARAVGAAMAGNPFAPVVPCHRVVGSDGRLRGYGGGLDMKRALLAMEEASQEGADV